MKKFLRYAAWIAVVVAIAGSIVAFSERKLLSRYITHSGDPLTVPQSWFDPVEVVKGNKRDNILPEKLQASIIPENIVDEVTAYAEGQGSQGLIVMHNEAIQVEEYWGGANRETLFNPQSMSKTVLAMLLGVAIEEGHIESVDDPIGIYIEEWGQDNRGSSTIRQALWMSLGLEQMSTSYDINLRNRGVWYNFGDDFDGMILDLEQVTPAGSEYEYNNEETNLLGIVIERATGQRYANYLSEKLWRPLELADALMYLDREEGSVMKSCCIFSRPYDWAKLGQLIINRGVHNGKQIVPATWIDEMLQPSPNVGWYGYQIWLGSDYITQDRIRLKESNDYRVSSERYLVDDMVVFVGHGEQRVWISPSQNLVIVRATKKWASSWVETKIPNSILQVLIQQDVAIAIDGAP